ncbi:MAG TPA: cell wall hydrolase [Pelagibacterium sp.]|jgi:spore germination cell wall hydrolase CwlJ-like protein|nr:cell wall hydrolase [Pelagibacterium sp.]HCO55301.1 cell wall hydrolase [Pelagibacterium sp.]|tara:strand:- start:1973 stop:2431 length:459 start_codon:yes stop_codon:yes gene_type:complete
MRIVKKVAAIAVSLAALTSLSGCVSLFGLFGSKTPHECMTRVMYFESNRSSPDGMLAVGTVVMNRANSHQFPSDVCGVVGQKNQFADGVLSRQMTEQRSLNLAAQMATRVLRGERHPGVQDAMYFHTAGLTFPYRNMHYVLVAGGNAFYARR